MESAPSPAPAASSPPPASSPAPTSPDRNPKIQTAANFDSSTYTHHHHHHHQHHDQLPEQLFCRRGDLFCSCEVFGKVLETFGVLRRRFGKNNFFFKTYATETNHTPPPPNWCKTPLLSKSQKNFGNFFQKFN